MAAGGGQICRSIKKSEVRFNPDCCRWGYVGLVPSSDIAEIILVSKAAPAFIEMVSETSHCAAPALPSLTA